MSITLFNNQLQDSPDKASVLSRDKDVLREPLIFAFQNHSEPRGSDLKAYSHHEQKSGHQEDGKIETLESREKKPTSHTPPATAMGTIPQEQSERTEENKREQRTEKEAESETKETSPAGKRRLESQGASQQYVPADLPVLDI